MTIAEPDRFDQHGAGVAVPHLVDAAVLHEAKAGLATHEVGWGLPLIAAAEVRLAAGKIRAFTACRSRPPPFDRLLRT